MVEIKSGNFTDQPRICPTLGELLQSGVVLELVSSSSGRGVELLRWDGENYEIAVHFRENETMYTADYVDSSILTATRLPREPAEYGDHRRLLTNIGDPFRRCMGFSRNEAGAVAQVVCATWLSDLCHNPMAACITGLDMIQGMKLFRLLHIFCRRAFMVAALTPSLPFPLGPTLLVNMPKVSERVACFWRATNHRGAVIPGPKGTMRNLASAKIIFCETEAARKIWAPEALAMPFVPTGERFPTLSEQEEAQLAWEYQPQLLMLRLRSLTSTYRSEGAFCPPKEAPFSPAGYLPACIAEDPEIRKALAPLLEIHEEDLLASRSLAPEPAIVETIFRPSHDKREISTAEITMRVKLLLHARGEIVEYNSRQIGWKLRKLGLLTDHNGKQKALRFTREKCRRVHVLATQFKLQLPKVAGCEDCKSMQMIEGNEF